MWLVWSNLAATKCQSVTFYIMTHALDRSLSSLTALAAASLLLSTTPAMAQGQTAQAQPPDAAAAAPAVTTPAPQAATNPPPSEVPAPPPAPAAPPPAAPPPTTDTAPAAAPALAQAPQAPQAPTMTSNPVVQTVPDSSAPAQAQSAADVADSAAATPARQAAPRAHAAARPAEPAPRAQAESSRTVTQTVAKDTTKPANDASTPVRRDPAGLYAADGTPVTPAAAPAPAPASDMERYWPIGVAGGVLLIGLAGYALTRRRREDEGDAVEVVVTPTSRTYIDPSYAEPATPVVQATPVAEPAKAVPVPVDAFAQADAERVAAQPVAVTPVVATPVTLVPDPAAEAFAKPVSRRKRTDSPEGVMLREGPLPTGEERAELLKRMMEAAPDKANPFHTPRARMRRARLILQAREQELREKATERFDWRTYKPSMKPGLTTTADTATQGGAQKAEPVK